jgi:putative peptidoglycan lipid II flippase
VTAAGTDPPRATAGRSAALVTAGILLSRVFGLLRQRVTAHYLGTSVTADVVSAAFRVGNITQNLLGEGTLSASFIPVYARLRAEGRYADARRFAGAALGLLAVVVLVASLLGVVAAPLLTDLVAAGFVGDKRDETIAIVRIAFPMTGLLVMGAWALGILNAHRQFFLPYAAPVVWNIAQIAALFAAGTYLSWTDTLLARALAWGAFAGAALQLVVLLPAARRHLGGALAPSLSFRAPGVAEAAARLPGALLGRGVIQLSGLIDTLLVSFLGTGANATFAYAQTLYLLPMSLLGTGEAAVALPALSEDTAEAEEDKRRALMRDRLGQALGRVATVALPAAIALGFFGGELTRLVLQTGRFDAESVALVAPVLAAYAVALLANAAGRVLSTTCFALGDTRRPARYAAVRVAISTAVSLALMGPFGVVGVVAGAVVAAWVELALLARLVHRSLGGLGLEHVPFARVALAAAACGGAGAAVRFALPEMWRAHPGGALAVLGAFGLAFTVALPALGLLDLRRLLRRS